VGFLLMKPVQNTETEVSYEHSRLEKAFASAVEIMWSHLRGKNRSQQAGNLANELTRVHLQLL
jgi:hypothetical protein